MVCYHLYLGMFKTEALFPTVLLVMLLLFWSLRVVALEPLCLQLDGQLRDQSPLPSLPACSPNHLLCITSGTSSFDLTRLSQFIFLLKLPYTQQNTSV